MLSTQQEQRITQQLADEINAQVPHVNAAIRLLDEGATVPFIARYRKELTNAMNDEQLRTLVERLEYLRDLEQRRNAIVESINEQGKLTEELHALIIAADSKQRLEDLYLPYKPKRRTRAQIAREAGLDALAQQIIENQNCQPIELAALFINDEKGIKDAKSALDGARDILSEAYAENADLLSHLRQTMTQEGMIISRKIETSQDEGEKFRDYYEHQEKLSSAPSHRVLALLRGREQGILQLNIDLPERVNATPRSTHPMEGDIARFNGLKLTENARDQFLAEACRWTWRVKLSGILETDMITQLRQRAETQAITIFAQNLKDLLLAAPAGGRVTMGLDPGIRTGVKVAIVNQTGKLLETTTIYPHEPKRDWQGSLATLARLCQKHQIELIAIGNGTASRETDKLASELIAGLNTQKIQKIVVSEAGASVYSASALASQEFPDLDVSLRGAVSIARRLQDPLAELVKIDPKSIGVGQYQHDVNQRDLASTLTGVVEDCVNAVGVEVNTASEALLAHVSGLNHLVARSIVEYRNQNGPFQTRAALHKVPYLGDKTFEQAAGFLRIHNGVNPLDRSSVHPEAYSVVEKIISKIKKDINQIVGQTTLLRQLKAEEFTDEKFGLHTIKDILQELEKPGRDPRPEFKSAQFNEHVNTITDLKVDMVLEGVITNVAAFGAFVDIGVHQDGLVHISALADKFVKDAHEVVKTGQVVKVKVIEVDAPRKRIALSMRMNDASTSKSMRNTSEKFKPKQEAANKKGSGKIEPRMNNALAQAFAKIRQS